MAKKPASINDYPVYLALAKKESVRKFNSKSEVEDHLKATVFTDPNFIGNVQEVASAEQVSYHLAYTIITNHLIDMLYEIDIAQSRLKKLTRVRIPGFINFDIGFTIANKGKKFSLHKDINTLMKKTLKFKKENYD